MWGPISTALRSPKPVDKKEVRPVKHEDLCKRKYISSEAFDSIMSDIDRYGYIKTIWRNNLPSWMS